MQHQIARDRRKTPVLNLRAQPKRGNENTTPSNIHEREAENKYPRYCRVT